MTVNPRWGELLVGAYLNRVTGCDVVSYNNRSDEQGNQMEADVIAVQNEREENQTVYACEVVTHLEGSLYSGTPETDNWSEYGNNDAYHHSLEKLETKFTNDYEYVSDTFPNAEYEFQFWAPVVTGWQEGGALIQGLNALSDQFEDEPGHPLKLVINQDYTECINELREEAKGDTSDYGLPAFRMLQILENLKEGV